MGDNFITGWVIGLIWAFIISVLLYPYDSISEEEIIEKGYGLYCPDTGNFAFKGECEND